MTAGGTSLSVGALGISMTPRPWRGDPRVERVFYWDARRKTEIAAASARWREEWALAAA
jgi:hypothetical protein